MNHNFSLGADPEFFIARGNRLVSAEGIVGGTKSEPSKFHNDGFFMQEDNVMVEFNIPPSNSKQNFVDNIEYAKEYLETYLGMKGYQAVFDKVSGEFSEKELSTDQACMFGCAPEYNVYLKCNAPAPAAKNFSHRFCGGHIHIGFDWQYEFEKELLVKALDITLGLQSVIMDKDIIRKQAYGKAGSCRKKSYGVEYRTLSNFWIKDKSLIEWVYEGVNAAFDIYTDIDQFEYLEDYIQSAINNNDETLAKKALKEVVEIKKQILKTL